MDHQGGDPVDAAMTWQERADDSRSALDADVDDAARRLEMVGRGPGSPDKAVRPRDAPGSANRRPRKTGGERPDGGVPLTQDATDEVPAPAPGPRRRGAPPPAVGTHVRAKDDAAVRGVVSLLGSGRQYLDVRTTRRTVVPLRKSQLVPTVLTPDEAAICSCPLTPTEYLQAQLDGVLTVRYAGQSFGNCFQAADGTQRRQFEALAGGGVRCALCDDKDENWRWETSGVTAPCAELKRLLGCLRSHSGAESSKQKEPGTRAHLELLLAAAGVAPPALSSSDDDGDAPPPVPQLLRGSGASSMSTATAALAPGDAALELLKAEFRRGEDEDDWELNEEHWSDRSGVQIQPSTTWRTAIRGVDVALASASAPAKPCDPNVRQPLLMFDDPRTLRDPGRQHFRRHVVAARALFGRDDFDELLGKPPPSEPHSSSFSSSSEDEALAEDEATVRRFWIGGPPGVGTLTHVEPSYLSLRMALSPDEAGDAQLLRATGTTAGLYSAAQAPQRSSVEELLPDAQQSAYGVAGTDVQASKREVEARRIANSLAGRSGNLDLAVFNRPCHQGATCCRNHVDPKIRCKYNHVHSDDSPLFYTLNYETGVWSETAFKKALDSGVMRDSVSGERVTVKLGYRGRCTITLASGETASRFVKQLRVPGEDD